MAGGIEVAQAYVTIIPSMKGSQKTIASELDADAIGRGAGESITDGIGSAISARAVAVGTVMGKVVTAVAGKAVEGIDNVVSGVYEGFSRNEQLVGGMQKLFGDSAQTVIDNASKAFQTAGMSANDYMQNVTGISASLVNSLGGDTEKAAQLADKAMVAMSDNVNTFGTDAQSVQNAFMGMAKGNYSMLDNLSLGFAGTQQGMVDLINASGVLDHKLEDTKDLADVGFGTMVEAVQAVQENMGIAGTTAKEAMGTMEGSVNAAKSAWDNVLTSIGSGDSAQLASAASGLVDSLFGAIDAETGKREGGVVANLASLVRNSFQTIGGMLPELAASALDALPDAIAAPIEDIVADLGPLIAPAGDAFREGFGDAIAAVAPVVTSATAGILNAVSGLVDFVTTSVLPVAQSVYDAIAPVIQGIWTDVSATFPQIQQTVQSAMSAVADLAADVWPDIAATVEAASEVIGSVIQAVWPVVSSVVGTVMGKVQQVVQTAWPVVSNIVKAAAKAIRGAVEGMSSIANRAKSIFNGVKTAIMTPINTARDAVRKAIDKIKSIINGAHLSLPHFKLPHFRIDGGQVPWGIGGKGKAPSVAVDWYAKGGFIDQPTLLAGVGERGGEFVWPSYAPYLDRYADALASRMGGGGVNVYLTYNGSGDADELVRTLTRDLRMMRMTGAI